MRLRSWMGLVLVCGALPLKAAGKKLAGKVLDVAAFGQIRSYCIDTSRLPGWEAIDVRDLVKTESKPRGLLSKLPWSRVHDCTASGEDAVIRIKFRRLTVTAVQAGPVPMLGEGSPGLSPGSYQWRALLRVFSPGSSRAIYEVEGNPLNYGLGENGAPREEPGHILRREAAYHAFWALAADVKRISQRP